MAGTLNNCSNCGHEWRTRGAARVSARCPACGSRQTHYDIGDAGMWAIVAVIAAIIGIGGAVIHAGPCEPLNLHPGVECTR